MHAQWLDEICKSANNHKLVAATMLVWQGSKLAWQQLLNKAYVALWIIVD